MIDIILNVLIIMIIIMIITKTLVDIILLIIKLIIINCIFSSGPPIQHDVTEVAHEADEHDLLPHLYHLLCQVS